ncbi:MAG: transcription antitermination factor NusB [Candidatus Nanopelagicales bacterium]|nr:hypothetical protein [Candidatus Nanopelagicales bacterium]MDP4825721.1 hypothetical protein [Candidatus Nanopelagicales bacterium]MDP4888083.1 hypothetical protein [Candidatus Nanopelagicales bacterium]
MTPSGGQKPRRDNGSSKSRPNSPQRGHRGARGAAYDLLHKVAAEDVYANLVWPHMLTEAKLTDRDAAFATELAYGTLRWRGLYDAVLDQCVDGGVNRIDPRLRDVLRLGVHQLLTLKTPPHAAVAETVALARQVAGDPPAGLVNAVLRRVSAGGDLEYWRSVVAPGDTSADLSIAYSHPRWIVTAFKEALAAHPPNDDAASDSGIRALLQADNEPARPVLVARPGLLEQRDLMNFAHVEPGRWSPLAGVLTQGRPADVSAIRQGRAGVQDEGSQLIALALANAPLAGSGTDEAWVDLAAGPGGKAAILVGLAQQRGAVVTAVEPREHRAQLVRETLARFSPQSYRVLVADGRDAIALMSADRVLLDSPCTGLGALRRRPEARWRRTPADLATLGPLQRELLAAAVDMVRPGGVVGYSTCSPHLVETDQVIADLCRARPDVELIDARPLFPGVPDLGDGPAVRLWPHVHGTDGMYFALLRRT